LAIETIYNSPVQLFPLDKLLAGASVEMMAEYNITFYDASYAALAYIKQIPLLTADVKGHKKIKEIEIIEL
jgi:predicted nucleic acid-binding protein